MARVLGIDLPNEKKAYIALTYIYGIGLTTSLKILEKSKVSKDKKAKDLTNEDVAKIRESVQTLSVRTEGELRRLISSNIKRLEDIKSNRGVRHKKGLPLRGQRTRANSRTRKGKKKTVGGLKRVITKT
jgi:small subunit ribosomal protein S13